MVLAVLMLMALLLCFKKVADVVGDAINVSGDQISEWAKIVLSTSIGLFLIYSGTAAMAVPFVGAAFMIVGVVTVFWAVWPLFNNQMDE